MSKFKTAKEALEHWDSGGLVSTVEMGGLGPGYEQAIHITAFEALRLFLADPPADWHGEKAAMRAYVERIEATLLALPKVAAIGLSGAQLGAAMNIASKFAYQGHEAALDKAPVDRHILVSKDFPVG